MGWFSFGAAALGLLGAQKSNKVNQSINDANIAFQKEAAQNAHQWEVEDLRKAGLNPILSTGGSGAHVSGVSMIPASNEMEGAVNNAIAAASAKASIRKDNSATDLQDAQTQFSKEQLKAMQPMWLQQFRNSVADGYLKEAQVAKTVADADVSKSLAEWYRTGAALNIANTAKSEQDFQRGVYDFNNAKEKWDSMHLKGEDGLWSKLTRRIGQTYYQLLGG